MWVVQPGGQFLALMGAPVPRTGQSGMPVGVHVAQAPRPPQHGCARSSEEENVIHTPTPGGLLQTKGPCYLTDGSMGAGGPISSSTQRATLDRPRGGGYPCRDCQLAWETVAQYERNLPWSP